MILAFACIAIAAIAGVAFLGTRTSALSRVREKIRTPRSTTPVAPIAYFERYTPNRTSGQGDAL
jgi:hypothetical protein